MRVTGVWFHRNDFIFSSDADMVSTLRNTIFKTVPQSDDQLYNCSSSSSNPANNNNQNNNNNATANTNADNSIFYSVTFGEACDAIKIAVVPIALEKDNFAAFACVGASDGFTVATLAGIARRMGNAIRLLIPTEDFNMNSFRSNRLEIKSVLTFTRRSLSEPDLMHGAMSEAFVDSIFDTTKPKFTQQSNNTNRGKNKNTAGNNNNAGGNNKSGKNNNDDGSPNNNEDGDDDDGDDDEDDSNDQDHHQMKFWSANPDEVNPIFEVHWIRGAVLCGNYLINSFEDASVSKSCQTTALGWDGFLYLARVMAAFGCDPKLMEHATHLENEMMQGEDTFRHLKLFRDDVLHTVEMNEKATTEVAERVPLEERTALKVSSRQPQSSCDCTATTGELLRELDAFSKEVEKDNNEEGEEKHPELFAMLNALGARYSDAPGKYEKFANAVHSSNCVDSLLHWGEAETKGFGVGVGEENKNEQPPKLSTDRPALHYKIRCPDQQLQFYLSFKFVSFEDTTSTTKSNEEGEENNTTQPEQEREKTSSDGYVIALFSYCLQYADDTIRRPITARVTHNGFKPVLDEVMRRMVSTAKDETALDTNIWTKIRSGRRGENLYEKLSPHLLAIDVVDRSCLLDPLNARILFDDFDPDIICSRFAPRLVRRSPILESVDADEARGNTNIARKQALQELMDTFRRSISRAQQMFSSGSVEGMWSTSEGAFFHGLFLTKATKQSFFPLPNTSGGGGGNIGNNNYNNNANNQNQRNNNNNNNNGLGKSNNMAADMSQSGIIADSSTNIDDINNNNNNNNYNANTTNNDAVALIAAPQKYLAKLPYGCLVPAATSMISSSHQQMNVTSGNNNNGGWTTENTSEGNPASSSVTTWQDVPMARIYHQDAPEIMTQPERANESLPLGLLEVHCMFTPNTDLDVMPSEVYYALSQMHAFS